MKRPSSTDLIVTALVCAILAGIGTPRLTRFIRQTQVTEPAARMPMIVQEMQNLIDSQRELSPDSLKALLNDAAHRFLEESGVWRYRIAVDITDQRAVRACVLARRYHDSSPDPGGVFYTSVEEPGMAGGGWQYGVHAGTFVEAAEEWIGSGYGACAGLSDPPTLRR
jgi:Tfp pilus assembly protein PilE